MAARRHATLDARVLHLAHRASGLEAPLLKGSEHVRPELQGAQTGLQVRSEAEPRPRPFGKPERFEPTQPSTGQRRPGLALPAPSSTMRSAWAPEAFFGLFQLVSFCF